MRKVVLGSAMEPASKLGLVRETIGRKKWILRAAGVGVSSLCLACLVSARSREVTVLASRPRNAAQSLWSVSEFLDIPSKETASSVEPDIKWGYGKGEVWAEENAEWHECSSGNHQSPIDVRRSYWAAFWGSAWAKRYLRSKRAATGAVIWHVAPSAAKDHSKEGFVFHRGVQFDGRTISVPYKASESGSLIQATGPDGERYDLKTMRVHTPSEHTFDGTAFPLEVQFEHELAGGGGEDGARQHLVISAFFHRGDGSPLFIRKLADAARAAGAEGAGVGVEGLEVEQVAFPLIAKAVLMQTEMPLEIESHLVHQDNSPQPKATYRGRDAYEDKDGAVPNYRAYYYYHGSRTEPPCDQTFRWVLLKHSLPVSDRDVDALRSLTGPNARPVEPLNGRLVVDANPL